MRKAVCKRICAAALCLLLLPIVPFASSGAEVETQPAQEWRLAGQVGGTTKALCQIGKTLYVGSGFHVLAIDASDPEKPRILGVSALLPQMVESIAFDGKNRLCVCCGEGGLVILDVSDPAAQQTLGVLDTLGYSEGAAFDGDYIVLADGPLGVQIISLRDPADPKIVSSAYSLAYVYDVALQNGVVYAAGGGSGVFTVDLTDPLNPKEAGLLPLDGFQYDVAIANGRLYTAGAWGGVHVLNIADPLRPVKAANAATPGWAMALAADGSSLLVLDGADGALLYNVAGEQPMQISAVSLGGFMAAGTLNGADAFVLDEQFGLVALNYANKSQPSIVSRWMPLMDARRLCMRGTACYVAGGLSGLHVYDISNAESPLETLWNDLNGDYVTKTLIDGAKLYVTSSPAVQLRVFDISDPLQPEKISGDVENETTFGTAFRSMSIGGGYAFIPGESADLSVDLKDLQNLRVVSAVELSNPINGDCRGDLFVSTSNTQLHVVDVSDPNNMKLAAVLDKLSTGEAVRFISDTVLLTSADPGIWIVDVSNPSAPKKIGQLKLSGVVMEAYIAGTTAYLSCLGDGVQIVDLSDPTKPVLIGQIDTLSTAYDCCVSGDMLVVADGYAGVSVYARGDSQPSGKADAAGAVALSMKTGEGPKTLPEPLESTAPSEMTEMVVTSAADNGSGTLRKCLELMREGTVITFDPAVFPADDPVTISLETPLPVITKNYVTIDASNAGVILDGSALTEGYGIQAQAAHFTVMGLQVYHFPLTGIEVEGDYCQIGGDRTVGTGPTGQGNVSSGNGLYGIRIGGWYGVVSGNSTGVDVTGQKALPNFDGIFVSDWAFHVTVGGKSPGEANVSSGNKSINIDSWGYGTRILGNMIGTDATGTKAIDESTAFNVILEAGATNCVVGGTTPGERNIISGAQIGFAISDSVSYQNTVIGNYIGTDISGTKAVPNGSAGGPWATSHHRIGGTRAGEGNLISGNRFAAVTLGGYGGVQNYVLGNRIGVDAEGKQTLPNGIGIELSLSQKQSAVGGYTQAEGNTVFGRSIAMQIGDGGCSGNLIAGNTIACPSGTGLFLKNGAHGNFVQGNVFGKNCEYSIWESNVTENLLRANVFVGGSGTPVFRTSDYGVKYSTPAITGAAGATVEGTAVPFGLVEICLTESGKITPLGFALADKDGFFTFTNAGTLTGKQTVVLASDALGDTSAFSKAVTVK